MKSLEELDFSNMIAEENELIEQLPRSKNNESGKSPAPPTPDDAQKKATTPNSQTQKSKILIRINTPDFHSPKTVNQSIDNLPKTVEQGIDDLPKNAKQSTQVLPTPSTPKKRPAPLTAPIMGVSQNPPQQGPQQKIIFNPENFFKNTAKKPKDGKIAKKRGKSAQKLPGPKVRSGGLRTVGLAELQEHSSGWDAWICVRGIVYDVTDYGGSHPGG